MAIKCPTCLVDNPGSVKFCGECGTPLHPTQASPSAATVTIQAPIGELATGTTFAARYQIIEELGQGGMGLVYKAQDTKVGEKVALKLIRPEAGLDPGALERFTNELKLARKIRHKNVCQMFDLGEDRGALYITMEYVHGEDLRQLIRKVGRLSPGQAVGIARQVCGGLEEAHKLGVVHRDLKPQNIMLDDDGNVRIMDFGIARSIAGKGLTGAGVLLGTPEYMSPEQVEGRDVDGASDIYSLGVVLYEMVTGRRPFDGETPLSIAHKQRYEAPEDPRSLDPRLPEALARVILKCLEKDKAARYRSAAALDADLAAIEQGLPATQKDRPKKAPATKDITVTFNLRKLAVPALGVLGFVAAAVILWSVFGGKKAAPLAPPASGKPSLAVMYFENRTEKLDLDKMVVTLLATNLSRIEALEVTSGQRLFDILKLLGKADAQAIDRTLATEVATRAGVRNMLVGSIIQLGGRIRLSSEIVDVRTGSIVGTQAADGAKYDDLFAMVDGITEQVGRLVVGDRAAPGLKVADVTTSSLEALDYYQKAWALMLRWDWAGAAALLGKAVEVDPKFALAYAGLAVTQTGGGAALLDPWADMTEARRTLAAAVEHIDRVTESERLTIRMIEATLDWNWDQAASLGRELLARKVPFKFAYYVIAAAEWRRRSFKEALRVLDELLEQDPADGSAYNMMAYTHAYLGDLGAAMSAADRFIAVQPGQASPYETAWNLAMIGRRYDEALVYADRALSVDPGWAAFDALAGQTLIHMGRGEEARARFARMAARAPAWAARAAFNRGLSLYAEGRRREAEAEFRAAVNLAQKSGQALTEARFRLGLGIAKRIRGDIDGALADFAAAERVSGQVYKYDFNPIAVSGLFFGAEGFVSRGRPDKAEAAAAEMKRVIAKRKMGPAFLDTAGILEAEIALARNRPNEALETLGRLNFAGLAANSSATSTRAAAQEALGLYDQSARSYGEFLGPAEMGANFRADSVWYYRELSLVEFNLGRLAEKMGDPAAAMDRYRKFLAGMKAADPVIPEVDVARKRLAALRPELRPAGPVSAQAQSDPVADKYSAPLARIFDLHARLRSIHPALDKVYPVAVVENKAFHIFEPDPERKAYRLVLTSPDTYDIPTGIRAAMPLGFWDNRVACVVTGEVFSQPDGYVFIFHEFVHCAQWEGPELELKGRLLLYQEAMKNKDYMWELQYPFPYARAAFVKLYMDLLVAWSRDDVPAAESLRAELKKSLSQPEWEYLTWQEWKEGLARFIENRMRASLGLAENKGGEALPYTRVTFYRGGDLLIRFIERRTPGAASDMAELHRAISAGPSSPPSEPGTARD